MDNKNEMDKVKKLRYGVRVFSYAHPVRMNNWLTKLNDELPEFEVEKILNIGGNSLLFYYSYVDCRYTKEED